MMLGSWIFSAGDHAAAVAYLDRAIQVDANLFYAWHLRGTAAETMGEPPAEVAKYFQRAVQLSPTYADAWYHLALAMDAQQKWKEAVESAYRAAGLRGNYDDRFLLAFEYLRAGDIATAQTQLATLLKERPDDKRVQTNLDVAKKALQK
jgi:Tfp pilus assembly protein PilF